MRTGATTLMCVCYDDFPSSRLESIMPYLNKPQTILRPRLKLKRQDAFSDLTLLSKEGKPILCHRCVLVARSGEFTVCVCLFILYKLFYRIFSEYAIDGMERSK